MDSKSRRLNKVGKQLRKLGEELKYVNNILAEIDKTFAVLAGESNEEILPLYYDIWMHRIYKVIKNNPGKWRKLINETNE